MNPVTKKRIWLCRSLADSGVFLNELERLFTKEEIKEAIYGSRG